MFSSSTRCKHTKDATGQFYKTLVCGAISTETLWCVLVSTMQPGTSWVHFELHSNTILVNNQIAILPIVVVLSHSLERLTERLNAYQGIISAIYRIAFLPHSGKPRSPTFQA